MAPTFEHQISGAIVTPILVEPGTTRIASGTVARYPIGSSTPYITLGVPTLRSGVHELFFDSSADAAAALVALSAVGTIQLDYSDQTVWNMLFVVVDEIVLVQDQAAVHWTLQVPYQEVAA